MSNTQSSLHSDVLTIQDLAKKAEEALPRTYARECSAVAIVLAFLTFLGVYRVL